MLPAVQLSFSVLFPLSEGNSKSPVIRLTENPGVAGSIPASATYRIMTYGDLFRRFFVDPPIIHLQRLFFTRFRRIANPGQTGLKRPC
jgi:hypothetical protein